MTRFPTLTVLLLTCAVAGAAQSNGTTPRIPAAHASQISAPEFRSDSHDEEASRAKQSPSNIETSPQKRQPDNQVAIAPEEPGSNVEPPTEFEELVGKSLGKPLPIFGRELFRNTPATFAPIEHIPVSTDYVIGPGDELLLRAWGQVDIDLRLTVDRTGLIHLPKVGDVNVTGVRYDQLPNLLKTAIGRLYRDFDLTVTLGELRSIQVFVVGNARRPGVYTVSSLSTLVNTIFASGGPLPVGSMRTIQLRRGNKIVTEFDLYDLLLRGDKSRDTQLLPGDVIYIPPVGPMVAIAGSVHTPAIYEGRQGEDLATLLSFAGGPAATASKGRILIERITEGKSRHVLELEMTPEDLRQDLANGDVVRISPISPRFEQSVTLRGSVAEPGRYQFHEGMRVRDLLPAAQLLLTRDYWQKQNDFALEAKPERTATDLKNKVEKTSSDINWEYALIQRIKPDLSTDLIPFNLSRALSYPASDENRLLAAGDIVTIFSQSEIAVPENRQSRLVRLEGEIAAAGVYRVAPGETLRQLLQRAGGPTAQAFLFASDFTRESVRIQQQERYQRYLDELEQQLNRADAATAENKDQAEQKAIEVERQRRLVEQMRTVKPTGRVVLGLRPEDHSIEAFPDIALEDGDRLFIPTQPSTVSVMGAVYNESTFLHSPGRQTSWYLQRTGGGTREADNDRTFILRADGSIVSKSMSNASWKSTSHAILPGDTIVVPLRLERRNFMKNLKDWTQVMSQFALGAAAVNVLNR